MCFFSFSFVGNHVGEEILLICLTGGISWQERANGTLEAAAESADVDLGRKRYL